MSELSGTIDHILKGYLQDLAGFDRTVELFEACYKRQFLDGQQTFFEALRSALYSEQISPFSEGRASHQVIIRAWARFGPTAQLPPTLFSLIRYGDADSMEHWARKIAPEFVTSLLEYRERFPKSVVDTLKDFCATYTYDRSRELTGDIFPESLIKAATRLQRAADQIEFERFERTLIMVDESERRGEDDLKGLLAAAGLNLQVAEAIEKAHSYLQSDAPFDAKIAGDLLRTCIDETHRGMLPELGKLTRKSYGGRDKDGDRRAYLREIRFITQAEEKFFSNTYSFISEEATHKLNAPKETMLFIERIVTDYLCLLLRRLSEWKRRLGA